jgi:hypothetical protein
VTVDSSVSQLEQQDIKPPLPQKSGNSYFIKLDNDVIPAGSTLLEVFELLCF